MKRILILLLSILYFSVFTFSQSTLSENQLKFIPNKGQWHKDIRFKAELKEGELFIFNNKLRYEFYNAEQYSQLLHQRHSNTKPTNSSLDAHAFEINFLNAQVPDSITGKETYSDKRNYIYPKGTFSNIQCHNKIRLHNLYKGIDLVLFQKNGSLKYEFHVNRKTDHTQIQLEFNGQDSLYLQNGYLITKTSVNAIAEEPPYAYQIIRGHIYKKVACDFRVNNNIVTYDIGEYDHKSALVIDPQLIFSTYSGSTADNWGNTACLDNKGNLYTGGTVFPTSSSVRGTNRQNGFPATLGSYQLDFQGGDTDIGILKFDSSGTKLQYATYIGGNGSEIPTSLITNNNEELYILGVTSSTNFPVSDNAYQKQNQLYQATPTWYINGIEQTKGTSFSTTNLKIGDTVYAQHNIDTVQYTCATSPIERSNIYIHQQKQLPALTIEQQYITCPGDTSYIIANNSIDNPVNWYINGIEIQSEDTLKRIFKLNDTIQAIGLNLCDSTIYTSNKIIITHNIDSSMQITSSNNTICSNGEYTFTLNNKLGENSTVRWYYNNSLQQTNSSTFTTKTLRHQDSVYAIVASNLNCLATPTITTNTLYVNDSATIVPFAQLFAERGQQCSNTYLDATIFNGGLNPALDWEVLSRNGFVTIGNQQQQFAENFNRGFLYYLSITSSLNCKSQPTRTGPISANTRVVNPNLRISQTNNTYCESESHNFSATISQPNFVPVGGYAFRNGTDIFVMRLNSDGSKIISSTLLGGSKNDGVITQASALCFNYGDQLRGDINIDDENNVYIASTTSSEDFPIVNGFQQQYGGGQSDAVIIKLKPELDSIVWSSYFGGENEETGLSIKRDKDNNVFVAGGTNSKNTSIKRLDTLFTTQNSDAYILHIDKNGSTLKNSLQYGTDKNDQAYFIDIDDEDNVYTLGQTFGEYPVNNVKYFNKRGGLFVQKFNTELDSSYFATTIGNLDSSINIVPDISPTAFLINECQNIFISGWGGGTNRGYPTNNNLNNMPITFNAYKKDTDGSDFYMIMLLENADSLLYATYFGGNTSAEHVDGGTSRFDDKGIVYQSVCGGCGGNNDFPQFPSVGNDPGTYPRSNGSANCNNAVFKFDLAHLSANMEIPTDCRNLEITVKNTSIGGAEFRWNFGDGSPDTITYTPVDITHKFPKTGSYTITLTAKDLTTCEKQSVKSTITTVHRDIPSQSFNDTLCIRETTTLSFQKEATDQFIKWTPANLVENDTAFTTAVVSPITSETQFIATISDSLGCSRTDTFNLTPIDVTGGFSHEQLGTCKLGGTPTILFKNNTPNSEQYLSFWEFADGSTSTETHPQHIFSEPGTFITKNTLSSKLCSYSTEDTVHIAPINIPNIITPNNDGHNDAFVIKGIENTGDWKFEFYNRWGKVLYQDPKYKNDYKADGLKDGVYYYLITAPDQSTCKGWVDITR